MRRHTSVPTSTCSETKSANEKLKKKKAWNQHHQSAENQIDFVSVVFNKLSLAIDGATATAPNHKSEKIRKKMAFSYKNANKYVCLVE